MLCYENVWIRLMYKAGNMYIYMLSKVNKFRVNPLHLLPHSELLSVCFIFKAFLSPGLLKLVWYFLLPDDLDVLFHRDHLFDRFQVCISAHLLKLHWHICHVYWLPLN